MRNKELFRGRRKAGRIVGLVLTLALAVSLLSGCGQSKERLTFGTGGTAGTYYSYGGVLAQYITNNTNVKVTAVCRCTYNSYHRACNYQWCLYDQY